MEITLGEAPPNVNHCIDQVPQCTRFLYEVERHDNVRLTGVLSGNLRLPNTSGVHFSPTRSARRPSFDEFVTMSDESVSPRFLLFYKILTLSPEHTLRAPQAISGPSFFKCIHSDDGGFTPD